ncbi:MAG: glycoside hydrolase family 88 protein [Clostridiales bacterium]|nr:glycoside hydrolase family 88 protein [Clostridiales bacterium]
MEGPNEQESEQEWLDVTIRKIRQKMDWVSEKSRNKIPYTTVNGEHDDKSDGGVYNADDGLNWWCNGFWGGMLWLMYHETGEEKYREIARISEEKLDWCFMDYSGLHHDVGFMWMPTAVADYRLTGNPDSFRRGMHAANLLAGRFNANGNFIRAWNDQPDGGNDTRGWAIIDCMINLSLLYWAGEESQDPRFTRIAMAHADTAMKYFVRPDGSVRHIVEFDPWSGQVVRDYGGQGYGQGSSWTRGQSWGIYGFAISYRHTGIREYLDTAKRIAHYFIANIPEDGLIPVDFCQPEKPCWQDDTAAAIAASGLLEIARLVKEEEQEMYRKAAVKLLQALTREHCCFDRSNDCFLQKCSGSYHAPEHEFPIIYGDYYFIEAMLKLKGNDIFMW